MINGILKLSQKEIVILADFIELMFEKSEKNNIFSTEIRREVALKNKIQNIHTYVKKYVDSGIVSKQGENYYPINLILPPETGITLKFQWT